MPASASLARALRPLAPVRFWGLVLGVAVCSQTCTVSGNPTPESDTEALRIVRPGDVAFSGPPALPALRGAWLIGAEDRAGAYALRVRLASGGLIPPHTHPDTRHTIVLEGTLFVGRGETVAPEAMQAVPAGAVYVAPKGVPHYVWARDGDVEYQENGFGPSGTRFIAPPTGMGGARSSQVAAQAFDQPVALATRFEELTRRFERSLRLSFSQ